MRLPDRRAALVLAGVLALGSAHAVFPVNTPVPFAFTNDVGFGNSVFVLGDHPTLGGSNPVTALKLRYSAGNVWTGHIALPPGTPLTFRYVKRADTAAAWGAATNLTPLTGTLPVTTPPGPPPPYRAKTVLYHSTFSNAFIVYNAGAGWKESALTRIGPGRTPGESLFRGEGLGEPGQPVQFVFHNGQGTYDKSPYAGYGFNDFYTPLDVFFVQDGQVFNYRPPATLSAPRIVTTFVNSTAADIPGRTVRIYLPRGYDQNTGRRYPVLYLHDGQNVFDPGGAFGSWSADATATREMSQGRVRECILVGVDNTTNRLVEYSPPTDNAPATTPVRPGLGSNYLSFLVDNVRPTLDFNYRTTNDPANTLIMGSSMGGLISLYAGYSRNTFGKIGVMSSAIWAAQNFLASLDAAPQRDLRIYTDWGTAESSANIQEYWNANFQMYDALLKQGYALNGDLKHVIGVGAQHNEAAWASRLPDALRYLLNPWDEPNDLARELYPPTLEIQSVTPTGGPAQFQGGWLNGDRLRLERTADLSATPWTPATTVTSGNVPWSRQAVTDSNAPAAPHHFWRLRRIP